MLSIPNSWKSIIIYRVPMMLLPREHENSYSFFLFEANVYCVYFLTIILIFITLLSSLCLLSNFYRYILMQILFYYFFIAIFISMPSLVLPMAVHLRFLAGEIRFHSQKFCTIWINNICQNQLLYKEFDSDIISIIKRLKDN